MIIATEQNSHAMLSVLFMHIELGQTGSGKLGPKIYTLLNILATAACMVLILTHIIALHELY